MSFSIKIFNMKSTKTLEHIFFIYILPNFRFSQTKKKKKKRLKLSPDSRSKDYISKNFFSTGDLNYIILSKEARAIFLNVSLSLYNIYLFLCSVSILKLFMARNLVSKVIVWMLRCYQINLWNSKYYMSFWENCSTWESYVSFCYTFFSFNHYNYVTIIICWNDITLRIVQKNCRLILM